MAMTRACALSKTAIMLPGAWKREYAVNPETLEIYLRKEGMDEPNKDYVWAANTIITLDFRAAKGTIVVP